MAALALCSLLGPWALSTQTDPLLPPIPCRYDSPLRTTLKQKYGACAGSEQAEAGVTERRHGIPTLIIVKSDGTEVCDGTDDVSKYAGRGMPAAWTA